MKTKDFLRISAVILALGVLLALPWGAIASTAEVTFAKWFTSTDTGDATGTTGASTISAVGGTVAMQGATPVIDFYSVTADHAANRLEILTENGDKTTTDAALAAGETVLPVAVTTAFAAESWVAIQNNGSQKFEVNKVASVQAGVSLTLARVTKYAYASGTSVKELTALYSLPVGAATITTPTTLVGERGETMGWHLNGSVAARINNISGHYE